MTIKQQKSIERLYGKNRKKKQKKKDTGHYD